MGIRVIAPHTPNFGIGWKGVISSRPLPINQETKWTPEPVWNMWRGEKSLSLQGTESQSPKS
jgi:hypothetical protein